MTSPGFSVRYASPPGYPGIEVSTAHFWGPLAPTTIWPGFAIWFPTEGANEVWYGRKLHTVDAMRPLLTLPDEVLRTMKRHGKATRDVALTIEPEVYRALISERLRGASSFSLRDASPRDPELMSLVSKLAHGSVEGTELDTASYMERLLDRVAEHHVGSLREPHRTASVGLRRARDYLHGHLEQNVTIADLVEVSGLSRFYLVKGFARAFGAPPHRYLDMLRIARARELMRSDLRLTDIAVAIGYADQSHFSRRFKIAIGMTPREYRQIQRTGR